MKALIEIQTNVRQMCLSIKGKEILKHDNFRHFVSWCFYYIYWFTKCIYILKVGEVFL